MQEVENTQTAGLLTSEELRSKAIAISHRRGKSVAQRRVARRWVTWILWSWVLPIIGLLTVLMAVASMSLVYYYGPEAAFDTAQTWVSDQFGIERRTKSVANQDMKKQDVVQEIHTEPTAGNASSQSELKSSSVINLQIDRSIDIQKRTELSPNQPSSTTNVNMDKQLPKGKQP